MSLTDEMGASSLRYAVMMDKLYRPSLKSGMTTETFIRIQEAKMLGIPVADYRAAIKRGEMLFISRRPGIPAVTSPLIV
jgi:hypothetical protein